MKVEVVKKEKEKDVNRLKAYQDKLQKRKEKK
ncbi:hypothetical protein M2145_002646 [Lachnospiraceae bacterium PF1-21]